MHRLTTAVVILGVSMASVSRVRDSASTASEKNASGVKISEISHSVTKQHFELRYRISNDSGRDIWLYGPSFQIYLDDDGVTLRVRRCLTPLPFMVSPDLLGGEYGRLRRGCGRTESLVLPLPYVPPSRFNGSRWAFDCEMTAKRVRLEVGYYWGDLRERLLDLYRQQPPPAVRICVWWGEEARGRREEVMVPDDGSFTQCERILELTVDGLRIPYDGTTPMLDSIPADVSVSGCRRLEIRYEPSMLEYFFPRPQEKDLLSEAEKDYLRSQKSTMVDDSKMIAMLNECLGRGGTKGDVAYEGPVAYVTGFRGQEKEVELTVYRDAVVEREDRQRIRYNGGMDGLRQITSEIQPFERRIQCASNLWDIWHRFRAFASADVPREDIDVSGPAVVIYPPAENWCYRVGTFGGSPLQENSDRGKHLFVCPGVGTGCCHYAMNPKCKPDSPGDVVLLFATEAGWNKHGGAELFTFDNHDPKGGCVVLNDGTVKFIRTEQELNQLRWE